MQRLEGVCLVKIEAKKHTWFNRVQHNFTRESTILLLLWKESSRKTNTTRKSYNYGYKIPSQRGRPKPWEQQDVSDTLAAERVCWGTGVVSVGTMNAQIKWEYTKYHMRYKLMHTMSQRNRFEQNISHKKWALQHSTCSTGAAFCTLIAARSELVSGISKCTQSCELFCCCFVITKKDKKAEIRIEQN